MKWKDGHRSAVATLTFVLGLACGDPDDAETGAVSCEHGTTIECACADGSTGTQLCAHDTSGYEPCVCGGDTDDTSDPPSSTDEGTTTMSSSAGESSEGGETTSSAGSSEGSAGASSSSEGPSGAPPTAAIFHPSDGEQRTAGDDIPWIGNGEDPEDGTLSGAALVWTSDIDGELGQGAMLDAPLVTLGTHTVTLTATDADGNTDAAAITIEVVAP